MQHLGERGRTLRPTLTRTQPLRLCALQFQPPVRDGAVDVLKKPFRVPALGHLAKPAAAPAAAAPPPKAVPAPPAPAAAAPKPPPAGKCDAVVESLALAAASSYLKKKPLPSSAVATPSKAGDRAPAAPAASASEEDGSASDAQQPSPEPLPASPASPASVRKAPLKRLGPAPAHAKAAAAAPTPPLAPAQAAAPRARAAAPSPAPPSAVKRDGGGSPLIYVPRLAALPTDTLATLEATGLNTSWPEAMQIMGGALRRCALACVHPAPQLKQLLPLRRRAAPGGAAGRRGPPLHQPGGHGCRPGGQHPAAGGAAAGAGRRQPGLPPPEGDGSSWISCLDWRPFVSLERVNENTKTGSAAGGGGGSAAPARVWQRVQQASVLTSSGERERERDQHLLPLLALVLECMLSVTPSAWATLAGGPRLL